MPIPLVLGGSWGKRARKPEDFNSELLIIIITLASFTLFQICCCEETLCQRPYYSLSLSGLPRQRKRLTKRMPSLLFLLLSILSLVSARPTAFFAPTSFTKVHRHQESRLHAQTVVVGKIILDKYGPPSNSQVDHENSVTIGGGGPQAAWGAAASLVVRDYLSQHKAGKNMIENDTRDYILSNSKHQVTFLAPVGTKNWTPSMTEQLSQLLPPMITVVLVPSADHITPTINIWHDENENVRWLPVDGSFDDIGANGLWQNRPSANDILGAIKGTNDDEDIILHAIVESGSKPTGQGLDALPFFDDKLMSRVSTAGVEPIVFADEVSGKVTCDDSIAVTTTISKIRQAFIHARDCDKENDGGSLLVVTPDRPCYEGMASHTNFTMSESEVIENNEFEMIVRDGGNGSFTNEMKMTAATLRTIDKTPVNPTGAGNAFSAAYVACRGSGSSAKEAASIATAVGAVVCEYEHLPPWSLEVLERIADAAVEVQ